MTGIFKIVTLTCILLGCAINAYAQKRSDRTSSGRAAYGNTVPEFKAHKKKNQKKKKKAVKAAKRKKVRNNKSSYFQGRPY